MPIQHAIWRVGTSPQALSPTRLASEQLLESMIVACPDMLSQDWMLIGRQESTDWSGRIDLLAITPDGSLVLIEIKRDRTPREVVAQAQPRLADRSRHDAGQRSDERGAEG